MRVLDRYVLAECTPSVLLALAVSTFVLLMHRLLRLSDLVVAKGVPASEVLRLLALALPALLPMLIPVSLLLGAVLTVARLSGDGEVVAMRAAGVSLAANLRPVVALAAVAAAVTGSMSLWVQPRAAQAFKAAAFQSLRSRIDLSAEAGTFLRLAPGLTAYAARVDGTTGTLSDLFLEDRSGEEAPRWMFARTGRVREEGGALALSLEDGELHQPDQAEGAYQVVRFRASSIRIPLPAVAWRADPEDGLSGELLRSVLDGTADSRVRMELHHRLSLPVSCLVLGFLGAVLGLHHRRTGRAWGIALSIAILLAYYFLLTAARALGIRGALPPELASWAPCAVMAAVAVYAYGRKSREQALPWEAALTAAVSRARALRFPRGPR
jgi:lipopolysaccharide export system permease protein